MEYAKVVNGQSLTPLAARPAATRSTIDVIAPRRRPAAHCAASLVALLLLVPACAKPSTTIRVASPSPPLDPPVTVHIGSPTD